MNVSYASFPISDTLELQQDILQTEEIKQYHYSLQQMGIDLILANAKVVEMVYIH